MQAMILAAGFGTRLLPFTKLRPKPLFPLLNEPLLLLTVRHLQAAGFDHIIVNCHYLKEQIVSALSGVSGVHIQEEETVLGTGGGLRMALKHMRDEPLLVTNADIYHSVDLADLYSTHGRDGASVTMAMHNYWRFNTVCVENDRIVTFSPMVSGNCLAFTGIHVLNPEVLCTIPLCQEYSIIDRYRCLLEEGKKISALRVDGCSWTDMGTVEDYLALHGQLLRNEIPLWNEFKNVQESPFLFHRDVVSGGGEFKDWVCVGRAQLAEKVCLQRCVVWDGAELSCGSIHHDMLLV